MRPRTYGSPESFKQALEERLRSSAKSGIEFARQRQLLVFDRFLARVVAVLGDAATLKGGLALELRLDQARTTKDVDLQVVGSAGYLYGQPIGVDAVFGEPIFGVPETVVADDLLAFVGIPPPSVRLYPIETHIAEKLPRPGCARANVPVPSHPHATPIPAVAS